MTNPPALTRQRASRFEWEPDPHQNWTYITLSPSEFVNRCESIGYDISVNDMNLLFKSNKQTPAYSEYYDVWKSALSTRSPEIYT